jgi:signal transduction histidine kinase
MVASILVFAALNFYIFIDGILCTRDFILMNRRISFTEMTADPPRITETLDVDRDGEDEVFHSYSYGFPNKQAVSLFEPLQRHYNRLYYGEILVPIRYTFFGAYFDDDLKTYVFRFLDYQKGKLFLKDVDNRGYLRKQLEVKGLGLMLNPKAEMTFLKSLVVDLEGDGKKELIVLFKQDDQSSPGVILCIDPLSGELLWKYLAGTVIVEAECRDLDNNNKKEIILSTFSSLKGVEHNGTSDAYSYVIVLESNGNKRWNKEIGDRYTFTRTAIADIDNDNLLDIIAATETHPKRERGMGEIFVFDGPTGNPKANSPFRLYNVSFSKPLVHRSEAGTRIYVGDSNGNIRLFDQHLKPLKTINIKEKSQVYVLSSHSWDYLLAYSQEQLMAFDSELERKVFSSNFPPPTPFSDMLTPPILLPLRTKSGHHALVNSDKLYLISQSESSSFLKNLLNSGFLFSGFIFLLMNGLLFYFVHLYRKEARLCQYSMEPGADASQSLEVFKSIAHQFKNPIGTVTWTAEKIKRSVQKGQKKSSTDYSQMVGFLVEDVKTMRRHSDNILKLVQIQVPKMRKKRLKPLLQKLVSYYKSVVNENIEVEFEMKEDVSVHLDEELFKEAMVNLLDNAIDAMPDGGKLRLAVVPVVSPEKGSPQHVLIEIEDTGSGIDEADIPQLFTPFFTKKENKKGTGIGLTICKRITEAHGGTIAVHSRKGFGTKFAITIPVQ